MQHDSEDEYGFWADVPERAFRRPSRGARRHTSQIPVVVRRAGSGRSGWRRLIPTRVLGRPVRTVDGAIDPFVARVGALVAAMVLLVPVALSLRDDRSSMLTSSGTGGASAIPAPVAPVADASSVAPVPVETVASVTEVPVTDAPVTATEAPTTQRPAPVEASKATSPVTAATAPATPPATKNVTTTKVASKVTPSTGTKVAATKPACSPTYTIVGGDSWIGIARRAGVTVKSLLAANGAKATTAIYPGRSLCLPDGATVPAAAPTSTKPASTPTTVKPKVTTSTKPVTTTTVKPASTPATTKPKVTTTTAKPTTTTAAPQRSYSRAEVEAIIREVWPDDLEDEAVRIATRESNLKPAARNSCCVGLFQIYFNVHKSWLATLGITSSSQLTDPRVNAQAALTLYYRAGGWGPWKL